MGGSGVLPSCFSRSFSSEAQPPPRWILSAAASLLSYLRGVLWSWCSTLQAATAAEPPHILQSTGLYSPPLSPLTSIETQQQTPQPQQTSLYWGWHWWVDST